MLVILSSIPCYGQVEEALKRHWQVKAETSFFNTLDAGMEYGITYFPIEYVGVGVSIGGAENFNGSKMVFWKEVHEEAKIYFTEDLADNVWFRCGVQLKSPSFWKSKNHKLALSFKLGAGITIPIPVNRTVTYHENSEFPFDQQVNNHGGKAVFFHIKPAIALDLNRWQFWLGYTGSNLDIYSGVRNVKIDDEQIPLPDKKFMNGFTMGVGFRF